MALYQQLYYLAYGSNLHPLRLIERVPSAKLLFPIELEKYRLYFEKQGQDDSGKCNIRQTGQSDDKVHAAMYQISMQHKPLLDEFEGLNAGYMDHQLTLQHQGQEYDCFSYFAQAAHIVEGLKPYHWYKELVIQGVRYLQFPDDYLVGIRSVESMPDKDIERCREHQTLISRMSEYQ